MKKRFVAKGFSVLIVLAFFTLGVYYFSFYENVSYSPRGSSVGQAGNIGQGVSAVDKVNCPNLNKFVSASASRTNSSEVNDPVIFDCNLGNSAAVAICSGPEAEAREAVREQALNNLRGECNFYRWTCDIDGGTYDCSFAGFLPSSDGSSGLPEITCERYIYPDGAPGGGYDWCSCHVSCRLFGRVAFKCAGGCY